MSQPLDALAAANAARRAQAEVKRRIRAGTLSVQEAARDPVMRNRPLAQLLEAQARWGRARTVRLLKRVGIPETTPCGMLTERRLERVAGILREMEAARVRRLRRYTPGRG